MRQVSIRFADAEHEKLAALSESLERSLNDLVREAVRQYIERQAAAENPR
jgi:predicted DNA-binding protein